MFRQGICISHGFLSNYCFQLILSVEVCPVDIPIVGQIARPKSFTGSEYKQSWIAQTLFSLRLSGLLLFARLGLPNHIIYCELTTPDELSCWEPASGMVVEVAGCCFKDLKQSPLRTLTQASYSFKFTETSSVDLLGPSFYY